MNAVIRSYEAAVDDVKPGERSVIAKIGGRAVDRHRTIIDPRGIDLGNYRSNPIVLWEHGRDPQRGMMPVGKNLWIKSDGDKLIAKTVFRDDAYSQELFKAYQDGDLRGWSVNVLAHEASPPTREEIRATPELERDCELIYRKTELAEYSAVAIPSHRDALTVLASRGIWIPDEARTMTDSVGGMEGGGATVEPAEAGPQERRIVEEHGEFFVLSEDGSKRLGGPYKSREEADKRLEQIEYFKHHDKGRSLWTICHRSGRVVAAYADERIADESLAMLEGSRSGPSGYEQALARCMIEQRAADDRRIEHFIARLELELFCRV